MSNEDTIRRLVAGLPIVRRKTDAEMVDSLASRAARALRQCDCGIAFFPDSEDQKLCSRCRHEPA